MDEVTWFVPFEEDLKHDRIVMRHGDNERVYVPERKPGKWIKAIDPDVNAWTGGHTCSECGRVCVQMSMNYCANCGAKMEVHDGK